MATHSTSEPTHPVIRAAQLAPDGHVGGGSVIASVIVRLVIGVAVVSALMWFAAEPVGAQIDTPSPPQVDGPVADTPAPAGTDTPAVDPPNRPLLDGFFVTPPADPEEPAGVNVSIVSDDSGISRSVLIVLLLTIGSLAPGLLMLMTCFTRFIIVLSLARQALGAPSVPPNQVLVGLALFLTFFIMSPVLSEVNEVALQPLLRGEMTETEAFDAGFDPLRDFMLAQTDESDLAVLLDLADGERPTSEDELSWTVVVPAFVLSELRTAFMIGFMVFIPFLVVDLVISSVLMALGMVMLPPVFISLPVKLLLFVLVDGWALLIGSLVDSVNV